MRQDYRGLDDGWLLLLRRLFVAGVEIGDLRMGGRGGCGCFCFAFIEDGMTGDSASFAS